MQTNHTNKAKKQSINQKFHIINRLTMCVTRSPLLITNVCKECEVENICGTSLHEFLSPTTLTLYQQS